MLRHNYAFLNKNYKKKVLKINRIKYQANKTFPIPTNIISYFYHVGKKFLKSSITQIKVKTPRILPMFSKFHKHYILHR